jgi:hypothetical protein
VARQNDARAHLVLPNRAADENDEDNLREGEYSMAEEPTRCVEPFAGPITAETEQGETKTEAEEVRMAGVRVGQKAPDFELSAYIDGGFKNVKLSDYLGKWVVLCFYPGDFTFV